MYLLGVILACLMVISPTTYAGKDDKQQDDDGSRSLTDWCHLPSEVLMLKCNSLNLPARGGRNTLAIRLYNHFHPNLRCLRQTPTPN